MVGLGIAANKNYLIEFVVPEIYSLDRIGHPAY